ncbi:PPE family protein [Mycobacterium sp. 1423905.2]|uniref:PPE family protein n=1 Tax=Mycobacterium sp. 1423905.2 TaxID=1856859 RepID=UPI0007FC042F|nr:PPE family protein [Mycobacterium sp. 1423905.2]OBJ54194.1 hypothetical protein A9W95_17460 [Mycobacterium sp. 1423905.2]
MDFGALPPEINSARMYAGVGAGPLLAASVAWDELATELHAAASAYSSVIATLTSAPWQGAAAISAASAATPYAAWMTATAEQAEEAAAQARAAVAAYEAAYTATVPPMVVAANRSLLALLVATNFFGQNSPAIAATEAHYCEMWAQDSAAMFGYAGSSSAASTLTPFEAPPQVAAPTAGATQAAAVSQAGGEAGATQGTLASLVNSVPSALQDMASPTAAGTSPLSLAGLGTLPSGSTTDMANLIMLSTTPIYGLSGLLSIAQSLQGMASTAAQQVGADVAGLAADAAGAAGSAAEGLGGGVMGSMGQAASLGSLSVPAGWTSVIPTSHFGSISSALPGGSLNGGMGTVPPSVLGGLPRTAAAPGPAPGPRYGLVPTVMAQPPSAGYGELL